MKISITINEYCFYLMSCGEERELKRTTRFTNLLRISFLKSRRVRIVDSNKESR